MKIALVNLPHRTRVMRRYVASYNAPNFLIPPLELMSVGAVLEREHEVILIDAIAEELSREGLLRRLTSFGPELIVSLLGFKIVGEDIAELAHLRSKLPDAQTVAFGYLPSQCPRETLAAEGVDMVVIGEPEITLAELCRGGGSPEGVAGLAFKRSGEIILNEPRPRIQDLDSLPFADISLIKTELYNESFLDRPIAVLLTARGCPFRCSYCVKTYGGEVVYRSAENVLAELSEIVSEHGIRNIRFLDDTFTANLPRAKAICRGMIERRLGIQWTCLTRPDTLDDELLGLMKQSGCKRIYAGIESGSQRVLDYYRKGYRVESVERQVRMIKKAGIEVSAFFIVGAPIETDEDVEQSISLAKRLDVDYIIVTMLQYWPGTDVFELMRGDIDWNLLPLRCRPRDGALARRAIEWERRFYREFYLRPGYILRRLSTLARTPSDIVEGYRKLKRFVRQTSPEGDDFI